jgi:hypothetical protein
MLQHADRFLLVSLTSCSFSPIDCTSRSSLVISILEKIVTSKIRASSECNHRFIERHQMVELEQLLADKFAVLKDLRGLADLVQG